MDREFRLSEEKKVFGVRVVVCVAGGTYDEMSTPPILYNNEDRERLRERDLRKTTRQLCHRAAEQQAGASPITAEAIGSGSAALVGEEATINWPSYKNQVAFAAAAVGMGGSVQYSSR